MAENGLKTKKMTEKRLKIAIFGSKWAHNLKNGGFFVNFSVFGADFSHPTDPSNPTD